MPSARPRSRASPSSSSAVEVLPASSASPGSARSSPATTAISELLPEPDGPSKATLSPGIKLQVDAVQHFGAARLAPSDRRISARSIRGSVMPAELGTLRSARQWARLACHDPPVDCRRPSVDRRAGAAPSPERPLVLAFGDSLTAGYGLDTGPRLRPAAAGDAAPARHCRAGRRRRRVRRHQRRGQARLGWTLDGLKRKPDLVIVELGANDMLRGLDPAQTRTQSRRHPGRAAAARNPGAARRHARGPQPRSRLFRAVRGYLSRAGRQISAPPLPLLPGWRGGARA